MNIIKLYKGYNTYNIIDKILYQHKSILYVLSTGNIHVNSLDEAKIIVYKYIKCQRNYLCIPVKEIDDYFFLNKNDSEECKTFKKYLDREKKLERINGN